MKVKHVPNEDKYSDRVYFKCPGCNELHAFNPQVWDHFNGDTEKPTAYPSILVTAGKLHGVCHSFITDGFIRFEPDSTHSLSGQTVELPHLTEDDLKYFD